MCGISGYILAKPLSDGHLIRAMNDSLAHRGPDDEGYVVINRRRRTAIAAGGVDTAPSLVPVLAPIDGLIAEHDVAMGHRRFSIVDLSPDGHQPMASREGDIVLAFNGEIYNYVELRNELQGLGHQFRTRSDTEVIVCGFLEWGERLLPKLNGPFALALYDRRRNGVLLARDRLGKAPLYLIHDEGALYWASEIKALFCVPGFRRDDVSAKTAMDYLYFGWRDRDGPFWSQVIDFPPAHHAWCDFGATG